jgi:hypothetical protein
MILFWKIRYLDRADNLFKDRCPYLHTETLDPVTRAAVEFIIENRSKKTEREILKYKHLFIEGALEQAPGNPMDCDGFNAVFLMDYFEDEAGKEITPDEMAQIVTGSPTARALPSGAKQLDIDFMFAEPKPIPLAEVSLTADRLDCIKQQGRRPGCARAIRGPHGGWPSSRRRRPGPRRRRAGR